MSPLVSIIIPAYNAAPWISATLDSALAQTHRPIEIIVVDDGSTDPTPAILSAYANTHGVNVITQENRGQCAAINRGLSLAQGDFITFLDADDLLHPEKTAHQLRRLAEFPEGWIASCEWARFYTEPSESIFREEAIWRDLEPVDWLVTSWRGGGMMHGAAWLAPRTIIDKTGGWDERLSLINDLDYFTRLLLASRGIAFCPGARTYYRSGLTMSLSGQKTRQAVTSALLATELACQSLQKHDPSSQRIRNACADMYQRLIFSLYPAHPDLVMKAEKAVSQLGGSHLVADGGLCFTLTRRVLGWKWARRLQLAIGPNLRKTLQSPR